MTDNTIIKRGSLESVVEWDLKKIAFFLFLSSVIVRTMVGGYLKAAGTYTDEWIYLQSAYDIAKGYGANSRYGLPYLGSRWLYSVLIAPACLLSDIRLRFYAIAFINSVTMSAAILPVYKMARLLLKKQTHIVISMVLFVLMPFMNLCSTFMADVLFFLLATSIICTQMYLIRWRKLTRTQRVLCLIFWPVLVSLAMLTKRAGFIFLIQGPLFLVWIPCSYLRNDNILKESDKASEKKNHLRHYSSGIKKLFTILIVCISIFALAIIWRQLMQTSSLRRLYDLLILSIKNYTEKFLKSVLTKAYRTICLSYFFSIFLGLGFFPILINIFAWKWQDRYERMESILNGTFWGLFILSAVNVSYDTYLLQGYTLQRVFFRYFFFYFMPCMLFFMNSLEKMEENKHYKRYFAPLFACMVLFITGVIFFYKGAEINAPTDQALLYWTKFFVGNYRIIAVILLALYALIGFILLVYSQKAFLLFFLIIWFITQGYNNYMSNALLRQGYTVEADDSIHELRTYILNHPDEHFLVVDHRVGPVGGIETVRRGDTYLDTKNVMHTSFEKLCSCFTYTANSLNLTVSGIPSYDAVYPPTTIDYILLTNEWCAEPAEGYEPLDIGGGQWYRVYKLTDPTKMPYIPSFYLPPVGTFVFHAREPLFHSSYENYLSDENPGMLLYGPFGVLNPGSYRLTISYNYAGDSSDGTLGTAYVNGSVQGMADGVSLSADAREVTIDFSLTEACYDFELQLVAEAAGLTPLTVTLERIS